MSTGRPSEECDRRMTIHHLNQHWGRGSWSGFGPQTRPCHWHIHSELSRRWPGRNWGNCETWPLQILKTTNFCEKGVSRQLCKHMSWWHNLAWYHKSWSLATRGLLLLVEPLCLATDTLTLNLLWTVLPQNKNYTLVIKLIAYFSAMW